MSRGVVKLDELDEAVDFADACEGAGLDCQAYVCLETGKVHSYSDEYADSMDPLPEDVDDAEKYVPVPHRYELDLGVPLVMRFVEEVLPDELQHVRDIFRSRGAYGRFKSLLDERDLLERWYEFEAEARKEALKEWCAENGLACVD